MTIEMANTRFYRDVIPYDEMLYAVIMFAGAAGIVHQRISICARETNGFMCFVIISTRQPAQELLRCMFCFYRVLPPGMMMLMVRAGENEHE